MEVYKFGKNGENCSYALFMTEGELNRATSGMEDQAREVRDSFSNSIVGGRVRFNAFTGYNPKIRQDDGVLRLDVPKNTAVKAKKRGNAVAMVVNGKGVSHIAIRKVESRRK